MAWNIHLYHLESFLEVEEGPNNLLLIDTCFLKDVPRLEAYVSNVGYANRFAKCTIGLSELDRAKEMWKRWEKLALIRKRIQNFNKFQERLNEILKKYF